MFPFPQRAFESWTSQLAPTQISNKEKGRRIRGNTEEGQKVVHRKKRQNKAQREIESTHLGGKKI